MEKSHIGKLPKSSGVYLFKNKEGNVIYVGKAINIRARVKSHFDQINTGIDCNYKKTLIFNETLSIDYIEVQSEIEALLLEANLIKKYLPKYNSRLKDDKSYLYIKITTNDLFPKVLTVRREKLAGNVYFGPFPSSKTVRNTLRSLRRIFPYCNCNFKICQRRQSCIYCEIGLDSGPCLDLVSSGEYRRLINHLILLLEGNKEKLIHNLNKEMVKAGKTEDFERAQYLKKQIEGIEYLTRPVTSPRIYLEDPDYLAKIRQQGIGDLKKILSLPKNPRRIECFDISDIHGREATGSMVVFQKGGPDKSQYRLFKVRLEGGSNDIAMLAEVIRRRLGHLEWPSADLIMVDGGKGQVSGVLRVLHERQLEIPLIGLAKRLEEVIIPEKIGQQKKIEFKTVTIPADSSALKLLQAIRDEAHRFALSYHRKLRLKRLMH